MKKTDLTTNLFGMQIFIRDMSFLLEIINLHLKNSKRTLTLFTPNSEQIVLAKREKSFAKYLGFADILLPDGVGLVFASQILSFFGKTSVVTQTISERITGIDLTKQLLEIARKNELKVLIIGGRDYEGRNFNSQTVKLLSLNQGSLSHQRSSSHRGSLENNNSKKENKNVIWWTEGYNSINNPSEGESNALISTIKELSPDIVFVAFGAPNQEKWIVENIDVLNSSNIVLAMAVGGTFDVLLGKISRAPEWMQKLGLEWFYRLIVEPWRWRRQLSLLEFIGLTIKEIFS